MNDDVQTICILIADDHPAMRDGLERAIAQETDMRVVGSVADGVEAVAKYASLHPDVVLMDLQMPKKDGLQAISEIRAQNSDARAVVLTTFAGDARVRRALALGAASYILKTATREELIMALRGAHRGQTVLGTDVAHDLESHRGMEPLSVREVSVLRLIAAGNHNRRIGERLNVSEQTVKSRIKNILAKLDAHDRSHAIALAMKRGFIDQ